MRHKSWAQPPSRVTIYAGELRRNMIGAWFVSSPGPGAIVYNHSPFRIAVAHPGGPGLESVHAQIIIPESSTWKNMDGALALKFLGSGNPNTGNWLNFGNVTLDSDDHSILVGWVPASTVAPPAPGSMFGRGTDGFGSGWSINLRHDGTNQVSLITVLGGAQQTAAGANANLRPSLPNFAAGRVRQASNIAVFCNGRKLAETATGNSPLRSSTIGSGMGLGTSGTLGSDPVLFAVVWKRALSDAELMLLTAEPWILWDVPRDNTTDMLPIVTISRDCGMPVDSMGVLTLDRDAGVPVDSLGYAVRDAGIPVDSLGYAVRDAGIPVDSQGVDPFSLAHAWNVRRKFSASLFHTWSVTPLLFSSSLEHRWSVRGAIFDGGLMHSWRVIPPLPLKFDTEPSPAASSDDVQCPVAEIEKTQ